jgi:precorrin-6Y C5,15-methyltransferase (decarboxylating)
MNADTITIQGLRAVERAEVIIGAPRMTAQFEYLGKTVFSEYAPDKAAGVIYGNESADFCVLVSGDTGFYSAAEGLCEALKDCTLTLIPGVSSLSYFFARLKRPWQNAAIISRHGRNANLADAVRRNPLTFALTGNNVKNLADELIAAGFGGLTVYIGENLGLPGERILTLPVSGLQSEAINGLTVLLVENPHSDRRARSGIPDGEFIRGGIPMTKSETRAITLSKLALPPESVCWDIGAGTGSVTVEMALAAYEGHVYALDKKEEAIALVRANCVAFHVGNVTPLLGEAPAALKGLPAPDTVFIGGSSGRLSDIFNALLNKNPRARVVINAVALETLDGAAAAFAAHGIDPDISQISVTHVKPLGGLRVLRPASPVFILSGGGG